MTSAVLMSREMKVARARELRGRGMTMREVGEQMGVSHNTVQNWLDDPDGSKQRARHARYRGRCRDCGAPTSGANGRGNAPDRCQRCANTARRRWTPETVIAALHRWTTLYGEQPSARDWNPSLSTCPERLTVEFPRTQSVIDVFGSWTAGINAAGLTPMQPGQHFGDTHVSVRALAVEHVRQGTPPRLIARRLGVTDTTVRRWVHESEMHVAD